MCHWWRHRGMFTSPPSRPKSRVWPTWVFAPLTCVVGLWSGSRFYRVSKASLEQGFVYLQATRQEWCTMRNSIANAWYIRSRPVLLVLCCSREVLADPTPLFSPTNIFAPASDRKSTRLNSSHGYISYAVFCLKKKKHDTQD